MGGPRAALLQVGTPPFSPRVLQADAPPFSPRARELEQLRAELEPFLPFGPAGRRRPVCYAPELSAEASQAWEALVGSGPLSGSLVRVEEKMEAMLPDEQLWTGRALCEILAAARRESGVAAFYSRPHCAAQVLYDLLSRG